MANKPLAEAKPISELLNHKYKIEYYQREYVWQEEHIQQLIDDLVNQFSKHSNKNWDRDKVLSSYKPYFMGSIIICEPEKESICYIVDGQQRLTTLTLLLIFLYHNLILEDDRSRVRQFIKLSKAGKHSFNLNITEREECMDSLLKKGKYSLNSTNESESICNITEGYETIRDRFLKKHFLKDIPKQALPCFVDWLLERVFMSKVTPASDEDAYVIFETMNDRGISLTPVEMLKSYLLANIENPDLRAGAHNTWRKEIKSLQDTEEEIPVKDGDLASNCIRDWLRGQYAKTMREGRKGAENKDFELIGQKFHRWVRHNLQLTNSNDFIEFIQKDFRFYSYWYRKIHTWAHEYSPDFLAIRSNAYLDFTLQLPAILAALKPQDKKKDIICKIKIVSTYVDIVLARRMWNHKNFSSDYLGYHMFHSVIRKIRNNSVGDIANILHGNLLKERKVIPDFNELNDFQLLGNKKRVRLFLARIIDYIETQSERSARSRFREYLNDGVDKKDCFEIEHIVADNSEIYEDDKDRIYENRDYIGGLLLLPKSINSSLGNASYKEKKTAYLQENLLAASLHEDTYKNKPKFNRFIEDSGLMFEPYDDLTYKLLEERYKLYLEIAKQVWDPAQLTKIAEER